jgi:hypothetical protein
MDFTEQQLSNFRAYEEVRKSGRFNMFDPRARKRTGLTSDEYMFVMHNYGKLKSVVDTKKET